MATKTAQPIDVNQYQRLLESLSTRLRQSPTAYTPNTAPSRSDLSTQLQLMEAQNKLRADAQAKLKAQIYGASQPLGTSLKDPLPPKETGIVAGLHALSSPLYGLIGAAETITGKGSKDGLIPNIISNIKEHGTAGDLLREHGITNKWVTLPIGFALDVALDPVNWYTAGTHALIPKLATGLKRGGIEGIVEAGRAGALEKAATAVRFTPFVSSKVRNTLATKAGAAEEAFRAASDLPSVLDEAIFESKNKGVGFLGLGKAGEKIAEKVGKRGEAWRYSPSEWFRKTKKLDEETAEEFASGARGTLDDLLNQLHGRAAFAGNDLSTQLRDMAKGQQFVQFKNDAVRAAYEPPARGLMQKSSSFDVQNQFGKVSQEVRSVGDAISEQIRSNIDDTGWKWYDRQVARVNSNPYSKKVYDAIQFAHGMFKVAKVPFNFLTSYTNAVVSNLIMAGMGGVNFTDPRYLSTLKQALAIARGKAVSGEMAQKVGPEILAFLDKYKKLAGEGLGLDKQMLEKSINDFYMQQLAREAQDFTLNAKNSFGKVPFGKKSAEEITEELGKTAGKSVYDMKTFISEEIFFGPFGRTMRQWQKNPEGLRRFIANRVEGASKAYNMIDQTYKIGSFLHLSTNGVTGPELRKIAQYVELSADDVAKVGNFYVFKPEKAAEIANELFMNYAAMPTAVKVLRSVPLIGSPFASFSYGMLTKTGKTLVRNPGFFNKATFFREETSRAEPQTPLEKAALSGPYYNYLNRYERMKLPFFKDYPLYLNIANWLPYLSLNIFQETERSYTNEGAESVGRVLDQLPFLKTPEGQLLYDYFVQPLLLNEAHPTGLFGQPIFYEGDTGLKKAMRFGQAGVETYTPSWLPPFGFRFRQLSNAAQGKTAQGVDSKTPGSELFLKGLSGMSGFPVGNINLNNVTYDIKEQVEEPSTKKKGK